MLIFKRTCCLVDFVFSADHRVKTQESETIDKFLDLLRELKWLWNMKVTMIPVVVGALGTVSKGLERGLEELEIRGRIETIQTTPYSSIDTTAAWKKLWFILSVRSNFHMIDSLSIAVHAFVSRVSILIFHYFLFFQSIFFS